jgi:hypothetical protein
MHTLLYYCCVLRWDAAVYVRICCFSHTYSQPATLKHVSCVVSAFDMLLRVGPYIGKPLLWCVQLPGLRCL